MDIERERRSTRSRTTERAFDSYRAYSEVLQFVWNGLELQGDEAICVGVLTHEGGRNRAIWWSDSEDGSQEVSRALDGDSFLEWLLLHFDEFSDVKEQGASFAYSLRLADIPGSVLGETQIVDCANEYLTLVVRNVFLETPESENAMSVSLVVLQNCVSEDSNSPQRSMALSCGAHLIDKVVSYARQDDLRCMEVMLDSRLKDREFLGADGRKSDMEVAELSVSDLFGKFAASQNSHR